MNSPSEKHDDSDHGAVVKAVSPCASLSITDEVSLLEAKLATLSLEAGDGTQQVPSGPSLSVLQNDIRILLKNVGTYLQNNEGNNSVEICRIHEILKKPLRQNIRKIDQATSNATKCEDDVSSSLSYIKLVSEVCPPTTQHNSETSFPKDYDVYWIHVLQPITVDILEFLNGQVFRKCYEKLSASNAKEENGSSQEDASTNQGVGFAFHHQLGILLKGVRILLICLKRAVVNLPAAGNNEKVRNSVTDILKILSSLMDPLKTTNYKTKTDFDVGLDIRCNIGVGICYSMYYLCHSDKARIQAFFETIFIPAGEQQNSSLFSWSKTEQEVLVTCTSDMNRIALAFGILNTWLDQEHDEDLYLSIGKNILNIEHGVKEAVNLGSARVLEIWTDKLARTCVPFDVLKHVSRLFAPLEFFCFMYMSAHIDAVKNCCRNTISSLSQIYDRLDEAKFPLISAVDSKQTSWVASLLSTILKKEPHIKWIGLGCVIRNTKKSLVLLNLNPLIPEDLLTTQRSYKACANDSYVSLMSYHFEKTTSRADWEKYWIDRLFATQIAQNSESNWAQKKSIISIILNSEKSKQPHFQTMITPLLKYVVRRMNKNENNSSYSKQENSFNNEEEKSNLTETSLLAAETIKMAYELKITIDPKELSLHGVSDFNSAPEDSFRGLVPRSVLNSWLWSENPQIRLAGFALLVETKKTSDVISGQDFDSLKIFFKYNLLSQSPAFRQLFLSYFKKFTRRLRDGKNVAKRKKDTETQHNYEGFLRWIWTFLTEDEGLFSGSNFGRRCQSLECLTELTQTFSSGFDVFGVSKSGNVKYLRWLTDTYENNKIHALEILCRMPIEEFEDETFCSNMFDEAMNLCKSIKPPESITGRYLMTLLMRKCSNNPKYSPLIILECLYSELESLLNKVQTTSLIQVSSQSPPYGCIRCVRMILGNTTEFVENEKSLKYREYVERLLKLSFNIDDILFPVLGSAAPEGYIPGLKDSAPEENKQIVRSIAAQMLLVCAWRSMKEICLLMSDMCSWFVMEGETNLPSTKKTVLVTNSNPTIGHLLTFEQVSSIGDHLLYLLKNLMHRGVFEQVFVGFKQLATRLWKSTAPSLSQLPEKWLQDAMDQEHISAKSITRRSGGLPFIFQALLSAESDNETFLQKWVQRLLIYDENLELAPIRIHSMNVLRGLFRDATFSAPMMPFVPHGLKMAFRGLKSLDWTERNSGLMLYGAVMRRSFGAKLNLMNAPTFFRKFPQMYDFLLSELDTCIQIMESREQERGKPLPGSTSLTCDFTFHLLLLLSSFTASGRVEDTHFKLAEFIPRIRKCGENVDMEVRKLSARALIPFLISSEDKVELANIVLNDIGTDKTSSQNRLHGLLLQFLAIFRSTEGQNIETNTVENRFLLILHQKNHVLSTCAPTIFQTLLEILLELKSGAIMNALQLIENNYEQRFGHKFLHRNFIPGLPVADKIISNSIIRIFMNELEFNSIVEKLYGYFVDTSEMSRSYTDQFLELVQEDDEIRSKLAHQLFSSQDSITEVVVLIEAVIVNYINRVTAEFIKFPGTETELHYIQFMETVPLQIFKSLETELINSLIQRMYQICDDEKGQQVTTLQIKAAALLVLGKIAFSTGIEISDIDKSRLCDMVLQWSSSDVDDDMRFAVAKSFPSVLFANMKNFSATNQAKIWSSIFLLAQDDESSLRRIINRKLPESSGNACCDRRSLEALMHLYMREFLVQNPIEGLLVLIGLLVREDLEVEAKAADDEMEDRLFDKSEMNMYFEHQILTKTIKTEIESIKVLGRQLPHFDLNAALSESQIGFFYVLSNRATDSYNCGTKLSLGNILAIESANSSRSNKVVFNNVVEVIKRSDSDAVKSFIRIFLQDFSKMIFMIDEVQA